MANPFFFLLLYLLVFVSVDAQRVIPTPRPANTPVPLSTPVYPRVSTTAQLADISRGTPIEATPPKTADELSLNQVILQNSAQPLYRKPTEQELLAITPDHAVLDKFRGFLRRPKSGIFKLVVDAGCFEDTKVVVATENCLRYTMPGNGSSFSFRTGNYRMQRLADLTLHGKNFYVTGELMHGMLVNLGDVPIENVGLDSPGMRFIVQFEPAIDVETARKTDRMLFNGVRQDDHLYRLVAAAIENTTYVLRVVAYDGTVMRSAAGIPYNELDYDKRKDLIIVFRTVAKGQDGSLTIIWTEIARSDAPKFKVKAEKIGQVKFSSQ